MTPATRNDGLRLEQSSAEILWMRVAGSIPGVSVLAAAARCGPGEGVITCLNGLLGWQAPGSATPGTPIACTPDGTYMLEDGADPSQWLRVGVSNSYLASSGQASIYLADTYNALGPDDVSAANASAGITETVEFQLTNVSPMTATSVLMWLDPAVVDVTISQDNVNFYDPTSSTDPHVLSWSSIAAGISVNVWLKRVIPASSSSSPSLLNLIQFSWNGY